MAIENAVKGFEIELEVRSRVKVNPKGVEYLSQIRDLFNLFN